MLRSEEVERIKERALMLESLKRAIPGRDR